MRSFGMIRKRITDPRSLGSWCIKGTDKSFPRVDSSVPLMHRDSSDLGSVILFRIIPKERPFRLLNIMLHLLNFMTKFEKHSMQSILLNLSPYMGGHLNGIH